MKLKYCILYNEKHSDGRENSGEAAGFYQWHQVFGGAVLKASDIIPTLQDGIYDLLHIRYCRDNFDLIRTVRRILGKSSGTKLIVSVDIPACCWRKEHITSHNVKTVLAAADFIFATEYTIAQALEKRLHRTVYELPHPADIRKIQAYRIQNDRKIPAIIFGSKRFPVKVFCFIAGLLRIRIRFLGYDSRQERSFHWSIRDAEMRICRQEEEFCGQLAGSSPVLIAPGENNYGKTAIYAAALGLNVIGNNRSDALRRCYPFSVSYPLDISGYLKKYLWYKQDNAMRDYQAANARHKVEYYNHTNLQKRILDLLYTGTREDRFMYHRRQHRAGNGQLSFFNEINHISGDRRINGRPDEPVLVCLVRDGMEYLPAFLCHYRKMGIVHFIFIDNGSSDGTPRFLGQYRDVTVYSTSLEHKKYESEIRRVIIEEHCRGRWCLCVDIDEWFDYPGSGQLPLAGFLKYLSGNRFTAVVGYMLDMCAGEVVFDEIKTGVDLEREYCYYDISGIKKGGYFSYSPAFHNYNRLAVKTLPYYYGGIRSANFRNSGTKYLLIKHPLFFMDNKLEPVTDPHFCNKASIADVCCVLKHYKFTASFKNRVIRNLRESNYAVFAEKEHRAYYEEIRDKDRMKLAAQNMSRLESIEELKENGFLPVSEKYIRYIEKSGDKHAMRKTEGDR